MADKKSVKAKGIYFGKSRKSGKNCGEKPHRIAGKSKAEGREVGKARQS